MQNTWTCGVLGQSEQEEQFVANDRVEFGVIRRSLRSEHLSGRLLVLLEMIKCFFFFFVS